MNIGVLAVQGAFAEHISMLNKLGASCFEIRQKSDLKKTIDGIVLPGGESTVMGKLLHELDMFSELKQFILNDTPVFGTCAGMILLADKLANDNTVHLATMDITVKRNAYGRQLGSFEADAQFDNIGVVPTVFIRAPYIQQLGVKAKAICTVNGKIVAARQKNQLATAFHPELTANTLVHEYFLNIVKSNMRTAK